MKIRKITSCLMLASLPLWLIGCNSGSGESSTTALSQMKNTQVTSDSKVSVGEVETLDKWWNDKEAKKAINTEFFAALKADKLTVYFKSQISDLFGSLTSMGVSMGLKLLQNVIFPPGKDIETIRFETIMKQLEIMQEKLDTLLDKSSSILDTITRKDFQTAINSFNALIQETTSIRNSYSGYMFAYINSDQVQVANEEGNTYKELWTKDKFDFNIKSAGGTQNINPEAFKLVRLVANNINTTKQLQNFFDSEKKINETLEKVSGITENEAYGYSSEQLLKEGSNLAYLKDMIGTIFTYSISNKASQDAFGDASRPKLTYQSNGFATSNYFNRLPFIYLHNEMMEQKSLQILNIIAEASEFQYMAIAIYTLGGNDSFKDVIPTPILNKIQIKMNAVREKESSGEYDEANKIRVNAFTVGTETLNQAMQKRVTNVGKIIDSTTSQQLRTTNLSLNATPSSISTNSLVVPNYDFIKNPDQNKYALSLNSEEKLQIKVKQNGLYFYKNFDDVLAAMYWDGKTLKTYPTLVSNDVADNGKFIINMDQPVEQNLPETCRNTGTANDPYQLELYTNQPSSSTYLYCTLNAMKLINSSVNSWHGSMARQDSYYHFDISRFQLVTNGYLGNINAQRISYNDFDNNKQSSAVPVNFTYKNEIDGYGISAWWTKNQRPVQGGGAITSYDWWSGNGFHNFEYINLMMEKIATRYDNNSYYFMPLKTDKNVSLFVIDPGKSNSYVGITNLKNDFYTDYSPNKGLATFDNNSDWIKHFVFFNKADKYSSYNDYYFDKPYYCSGYGSPSYCSR